MGDDVHEVLTRVFGHAAFRPLQREAIDAFLAGRDVSLILPTAGGKSLCFQVPAVVLAARGVGPTLVVSPLVALMDDQVRALTDRGVHAAAFHSAVPWAQQRAALQDLASLALVYASPERLSNQSFRRALSAARLARAVVDEAHCISEWGHDFRPEYRALSFLKRELALPIMAVTATATAAVARDVEECLTLEAPLALRAPMSRPNLSFAVHFAERGRTRTAWVVELLRSRGFASKKVSGHALVYTATRKRAQEVQRALRKVGIAAGYYHAGRKDSARARAHAQFELGKTPVLVATSAYGMGVDIPSVRLVVHSEAPGSLEAYVQQAGRAGRDGLPSECFLGFAQADAQIHARLTRGARGSEDAFAALARYARADECRQRSIARHFSELRGDACGTCDVCSIPDLVRERRDQSDAPPRKRFGNGTSIESPPQALSEEQESIVVAFVDALVKPLGRGVIVKGLRGSSARDVLKRRLAQNPHFGALKDCSEQALFAALDALLARGLLVRKGRKYPTLWVAGKAVRVPRAPATSSFEKPRPLANALKNYRRREARRRRLKPYQIFQNRTLEALCEQRPCTEAELHDVWGLGDERVRKYGGDLLSIIHSAG